MTAVRTDALLCVAMGAQEHTAAVAGGLMLLRSLVQVMFDTAEADEINPRTFAGTVGDWVQTFDFIGNALSESNDNLIEALQKAGLRTGGTAGAVVLRHVEPGSPMAAGAS